MANSDEARDHEPRTAEGSESLALPIGMLILAIICGAGALILTVFGVWPAAILVLASAGMAAYAVSRLRRYDERRQAS